MCEVLQGLEDGTEAVLNDLDQSKAFDRVNHRFFATALETARFQPEFHKWISMVYHNPQAEVRVNGKRSEAFAIERSVRQGWPCLLFSMSSLWCPYYVGLGMGRQAWPYEVSLLLPFFFSAKVSEYADDITVFVWFGYFF